jgi:hypothetical protein
MDSDIEENSEFSRDKQKILIFAGIGVFFFALILFAVVSQLSRSSTQQSGANLTPTPPVGISSNSAIGQQEGNTRPVVTSANTNLYENPGKKQPKVTPPVPGAAAKVGTEIIYNVDITRETSALPNSDDSTVIQRVFEKMITDSIILQQAGKEGYIKLDETVFNSKTKDYAKRIELIEAAKRAVTGNADGYSGSFVAIWFHNQKPGKVGYAQGKQIAFNKIKPLHDQVISKQMAMLQASDAIIEDETLAEVDEAFRVNSYGEFKATADAPATFDEAFNSKLSKLKPGQVTDLHVAKDEDARGKLIDAMYIFGKVDKIIANKGYTTFEGWIELHRSKYEIVQY